METKLQDLDIIGHQFTWERGRNIDQWIEIRLDRVLVNIQWSSCFNLAKVYNLEGSPSDHSPLLLISEQPTRGNKARQFRFENSWLTKLQCFQIIKDCWEALDTLNVSKRIKLCGESLNVWGKKIMSYFGN